ncbi:MAG TPA: hypothetical protein DCM87_13670 [Planctomycetes bacterium]|nr:hypothetical protein [Planctomycetota bacterium]
MRSCAIPDPGDLVNTNGAGDAALAAVVHEIVAARLEGDDPWRAGAERACITRSTFAEIARYTGGSRTSSCASPRRD